MRGTYIYTAIAAVLEMVAGYAVIGLGGWFELAVGGAVHVVAAYFTRAAARSRRSDLSEVEDDLVLWIALLVPGFGPLMGGFLPRPPDKEEEENAHAVFEKYAEHVKPADPEYTRSLFTGNYAQDLARELDAESYHEVLQRGQTDQKRNALRRLAELGEPRHFALIRNCLLDLSHEVRLYAYSELERAGREFEEAIARLTRRQAKKPEDPQPLFDLARTYFRYASSGILDPQMAAFYFRSAERYAVQAQQGGITDLEAALVQAASLGRMDDFEGALEVLAALPAQHQSAPVACVVRAEIAYRRRDFAGVREEAEQMQQSGVDVPSWMAAMEGR